MVTDFVSYIEDDIPFSPGIYAFRVKIVTPLRVGLIGNSNFDPKSLELAREKIINRLEMVDNLLVMRKMKGLAREKNKALHLSKSLKVKISESIAVEKQTLEKRLSENLDTYKLLQLLELVTLALPPLYVGITVDQTLSARYQQHRRDFESSRSQSFGGRISALGIRWSDLNFSAVSLSPKFVDKDLLEFAEYVLHALGKPIFSQS